MTSKIESYNIVTAPFNDLAEYQDGIDQVYEGKIDGFIIKDVFTQEEIEQGIKRIKEENTDYADYSSFSMLNDNNYALGCVDDMDTYLAKAEKNRENIEQLMGFSVTERLEELFKRLAVDKDIEVPAKDGQPYKGFIVRVCAEGEEFRAHVGNQFVEVMKDYKHLDSFTTLVDQLSFFTVLASPESGGELVLYDLLWDNTPLIFKADRKPNSMQRHRIVEKTYKQLAALNPAIGDVLIFAGGKIWHKVNKIKGEKVRITLGGFLAKSKDEKKLYYWS